MQEKEMQALADELEIRNLVGLLPHLGDAADDLDTYLACFTEDAVWEFPGDGGELAPSRNVGRDAIAADRQARRTTSFKVPGPTPATSTPTSSYGWVTTIPLRPSRTGSS